MNLILEECIKRLQKIKMQLIDPSGDNETCNGIITANLCIRESIDTRCSLIEDIYGDPEPGEVHTNTDYALYCTEFTDSLYDVFRDLYNEQENTD